MTQKKIESKHEAITYVNKAMTMGMFNQLRGHQSMAGTRSVCSSVHGALSLSFESTSSDSNGSDTTESGSCSTGYTFETNDTTETMTVVNEPTFCGGFNQENTTVVNEPTFCGGFNQEDFSFEESDDDISEKFEVSPNHRVFHALDVAVDKVVDNLVPLNEEIQQKDSEHEVKSINSSKDTISSSNDYDQGPVATTDSQELADTAKTIPDIVLTNSTQFDSTDDPPNWWPTFWPAQDATNEAINESDVSASFFVDDPSSVTCNPTFLKKVACFANESNIDETPSKKSASDDIDYSIEVFDLSKPLEKRKSIVLKMAKKVNCFRKIRRNSEPAKGPDGMLTKSEAEWLRRSMKEHKENKEYAGILF